MARTVVFDFDIEKYLEKYEITVDDIMLHKPPAICYIDDRTICFDGHRSGGCGTKQQPAHWYAGC